MAITRGTPTTAFVNAAQSPTAVTVDRPSGLVDGGGLALEDTVLVVNVGGRRTTSAATTWTLPSAAWTPGPIAVGVVAAARDCMVTAVGVFETGDPIPATFTFTATLGGIIDLGCICVPMTGVSVLTPVDANGSATTSVVNGNALTFDGFDTLSDDALVLAFVEFERDATITYTSPLTLVATVVTTNATVGSRATISVGEMSPGVAGTVTDKAATSSQTRSWITGMVAFVPSGLAANAGADASAEAGELVTLDGSASTFATGFAWEQISGSPTVILDDPAPADGVAHFYAPRLTVDSDDVGLVFELTVTDGSDEAIDATTRTVLAPASAPGLPREIFYGGSWYPAGGGAPT